MRVRQVIPREAANQDIEEAISFYLGRGAGQAALAFIDALEQAYRHIGRHPASGSNRYAHELDLPGLRSWPLRRYPYLIFYLELDNHIDVWRVLHQHRDIPVWLDEDGNAEEIASN